MRCLLDVTVLKRLFVLLFAACAMALLHACAIYGVVESSAPQFINTPSNDVLLEDGIVRFEGFSVSFRPANFSRGPVFGGLLVPVLPVSLGDGDEYRRQGESFRIRVLVAANESLRLPQDAFSIRLNDTLTRPAVMLGPYVADSVAREVAATMPGHGFDCTAGSDLAGDGLPAVLPPGRYCIDLEFPVSTPAPHMPFTISLAAIESDGRTISPVTLQFKSGTHGGYLILR